MGLAEIQMLLKAPKSQFNSFGKYHYRNCEDILEAVKPLLGGCILTISDRIVNVGERFYIEATATFKDGDKIETVTAYARESQDKKGMDEAQITGSASSYARKYALNGLFLIDDTKDSDTDQYNIQTNQGKNKQKISEIQLSTLESEINNRTVDLDGLKKVCNIKELKDITIDMYPKILNTVIKKPLK